VYDHHLCKFDPKFHPQSFVELSREGLSMNQICAVWEIGYSTIKMWVVEYPEMAEVVDLANQLREHWWIENVIKPTALGKIRGNPISQIFIMKAMFPKYRDSWQDDEAGEKKSHVIEIRTVDAKQIAQSKGTDEPEVT
jgi:hypothetical protein